MTKIVYTISLLVLSIQLFAQTNYINNGGFEVGSQNTYPYDHSQFLGDRSFVGPESWVSRVYKDPLDDDIRMHSPDWYGSAYQNYEAQTSGAQEGSRYAGIGNFEMIQQHVNLDPGSIYIISMYIQLSNHVGSTFLSNSNTSPLRVVLSEDRLGYNDDDQCDGGYSTYDDNFIEIATFEMSPTEYPLNSGWHKVSASFKAPRSYSSYWISIDAGHYGVSCSDQTYILIDNVRLLNVCDLPCTPPEAFLPIEYSSWIDGSHPNTIANAGVTGASEFSYYDASGNLQIRTPWHVYITNVMYAEFTVLDQWGGVIINGESYSPVTLNGLNGFMGTFNLLWEGDNHAHHLLPYDLYDYVLTLKNCSDSKNFTGHKITIIPYGQLSVPFEERMFWDISIPASCCRMSSKIVGRTISGTNEDHSQEFTLVGSNASNGMTVIEHGQGYLPGPVNISSSAIIDWTSENDITLIHGVNIENGADLNLRIEPCGSRNNYRTNGNISDENEDALISKDGALVIYPNPSSGIFHISSNETIFMSDFSINVLDQIGRVVYVSNKITDLNTSTLDISNLPNGLYLLKILNDEKESYFKVLKQ